MYLDASIQAVVEGRGLIKCWTTGWYFGDVERAKVVQLYFSVIMELAHCSKLITCVRSDCRIQGAVVNPPFGPQAPPARAGQEIAYCKTVFQDLNCSACGLLDCQPAKKRKHLLFLF